MGMGVMFLIAGDETADDQSEIDESNLEADLEGAEEPTNTLSFSYGGFSNMTDAITDAITEVGNPDDYPQFAMMFPGTEYTVEETLSLLEELKKVQELGKNIDGLKDVLDFLERAVGNKQAVEVN